MQEVLHDFESVESYKLYRSIEHWCMDNLDRTKWRFDYATTICVCGVDIPRRIIFDHNVDCELFKEEFNLA